MKKSENLKAIKQTEFDERKGKSTMRTTTTTKTTTIENRKEVSTMKNTTTSNNNRTTSDNRKEDLTMKTTTEAKTIKELNAMKTASNQEFLTKIREEVARKEQLKKCNDMLKNATSEKLISNATIKSGSTVKGIEKLFDTPTEKATTPTRKPLTEEEKAKRKKEEEDYRIQLAKRQEEYKQKKQAQKEKEEQEHRQRKEEKAIEKMQRLNTDLISEDTLQTIANCIAVKGLKTAIMLSGGCLTSEEFDAIARKKLIERDRKIKLKKGELSKEEFNALPNLEKTKTMPSENNNRYAWELYLDAIKGINRKEEDDYIVGDGFALVQDCCTFLSQFIGKKLSDFYGDKLTRNGEQVSIMRACFYYLNNKIYSEKQRNYKQAYIDDYENNHEPIAIREKYDLHNAREVEVTENIIAMLELTAKQWEVLNARLQGLSLDKIAKKYCVSKQGIAKHLKLIQDKIIKVFGGKNVTDIYKYFGIDTTEFGTDMDA